MNYSQNNNKKRMRRHRSPGKKLKNKVAYIIFRVVVSAMLIGTFAVGGIGIGAYLSIIQGAPPLSVLSVDLLEGSSDTFIFDRYGNEIARLDGGTNRIFAAWEDISPYLKMAFVAIEDERFFEHNGVSAPDLVRAVYMTIVHDNTQGASTITQQVVKMDLGLMRNTIETKLQEQYLAIQYEAYLVEMLGSVEAAKQRILHRYLNMVPLGHGQYGVEAASWRYFNKPASEITLSEAAVIAAITSNPTQRSPIRFPDWNRERAVDTLRNMERLGMITEAEFRIAYNDDVYERIQRVSAQYHADEVIWHNFIDAVVDQLTTDLMERHDMTRHEAQTTIFHAGLEIHTTMDPTAQRILDDAFMNEALFPTNPQDFEYFLEYRVTVRNQLTNQIRHLATDSDAWGRRVTNREMFDEFLQWAESSLLGMDDVVVADVFHFTPQPQSAMTVIDHNNGHVIAMAGQRGEKQTNRSTNRAVESERQPGSVFKIFAGYAPALDMGVITAATGFDDSPNVIMDYSLGRQIVWPRNWHGGYRGFNHVRRAVEMSYNVIAAKVIQTIGPDVAYNYLLNFGFTTIRPEEAVPAMVLGSPSVTNLELTAAMGAIANGGILHPPILYTRVYDRNGDILIDNTALSPTQVLNRNSAYTLIDLMRGVITRGTGPGARFREIQMDNAGKTGTTQVGRDLYYTGSTPHLTASVWVGHDQPKPLTGHVTGSNRPDTIIWRYVMEQIHIELGLEHRIFERPPGFSTHTVCATSGALPLPGCPTRQELFAPGAVPNLPCHVHVQYQINIVTGMMPSPWCPPDQIRTRSGILRDRSWMEVAGDVGLPDSHLEVPRAVREGIICNVHNQFNAGRADYSHIDFENFDPEDFELLDLLNELQQQNVDEDPYIDDAQYQYPFGPTGDGAPDTDNGEAAGPPFIPDATPTPTPTPVPTPTPTPTPMPERTPIALPPDPTPQPTLPPTDPVPPQDEAAVPPPTEPVIGAP
ncbi:MAG: transglycosylase domain-containing protein [Clostridiales bacterium]|jgi:penicillin-binding protein 1A|nr:transglycosylase domain-containing protein [Clostridiales bacterium]